MVAHQRVRQELERELLERGAQQVEKTFAVAVAEEELPVVARARAQMKDAVEEISKRPTHEPTLRTRSRR
jgi:hypothetical protein